MDSFFDDAKFVGKKLNECNSDTPVTLQTW